MAQKIEVAVNPSQIWGCVRLHNVCYGGSGRLAGREVRVTLSDDRVVALTPLISTRGGIAAVLGTLVARRPKLGGLRPVLPKLISDLWPLNEIVSFRVEQCLAYDAAIQELTTFLAAQQTKRDLRGFVRDFD